MPALFSLDVLFFYGSHTNPQNNIIAFTYLGGGRDRILYPQYLSGIVLGIQEEDCPGPENTSTPALYHRVLPSVLPDYEPDSRRQYTIGLLGLPLLYHTRSVQQTLGHADPRLHRRNGAGPIATVDYS